jgi:hypothetical protein
MLAGLVVLLVCWLALLALLPMPIWALVRGLWRSCLMPETKGAGSYVRA